MASISKFSTAMLSVPQELTVAAANFNINFSLMKVEAPKEFHGLRDALSHTRRHEAEEGLSHITARTLGALFESLIPPIPNLTAAYGKRVSDVSRHLKNEGSNHIHSGLFADQAGLDGTSIWAAATSGQAAIAMHLLSCMLARIWKRAEATSLWVELVERRKQEIQKAYTATDATGIAAVMAAQQIFSREQLATWDSSARAWLQTADAAKRLQQTQLMLIINNVRMPVNANTDPYESVIKAWISAMTAMERLIHGIPQRVQDGSILLAISAWHLYPNMQVLTEIAKDVDQEDELMSNSLLTISSYGANTDKDGVFWSLPLARMRYYSPPVMAERHLASDTSRISMQEFQIVVLGAVIGQWSSICSDEQRCCRLIVGLHQRMMRTTKVIPPWFKIIANAAQLVIGTKGSLHAQYIKLLKLGTRRTLLNDPTSKPPRFFGLEHFHVLVPMLDSVEERIRVLRRAVKKRKDLRGKDLVIRYQKPPPLKRDKEDVYAFVPAEPLGELKQHQSVGEEGNSGDTGRWCWLIGRDFKRRVFCNDSTCGCSQPTGRTCICHTKGIRCSDKCHSSDPCIAVDPPLSFKCKPGCLGKGDCAGCHNLITKRKAQIEYEDCEIHLLHPESYEEYDPWLFEVKRPGESRMTTYSVFFGDEHTAAVFSRKSPTVRPSTKEAPATIEEIEEVISSTSFNANMVDLQRWWDLWPDTGFQQQMRSFDALVFADSVYQSMPTATINIEVIRRPLHEVSWTEPLEVTLTLDPTISELGQICGSSSYTKPPKDPTTQAVATTRRRALTARRDAIGEPTNGKSTKQNMDILIKAAHPRRYFEARLALCFSCVAWFESGEFDISPSSLLGVMALASGDSIYVASAMLADPSIDTRDTPVRRVFGNLGRPEMNLLIPPSTPRLSEPDPSSWHMINHATFDGTFQNCFTSTSLHLTFTDFEMPLDVGTRGLRDRQVILVEALVSVEDRGKHVGDIDVLSMFKSDMLEVKRTCSHRDEGTYCPEDFNPKAAWDNRLVSLDCWDEFLDLSRCTGIFRAHGSWQARLAAAAASIQTGKETLVLPEHPCLQCLENVEKYGLVIA